jgi:hypothetical protein
VSEVLTAKISFLATAGAASRKVQQPATRATSYKSQENSENDLTQLRSDKKGQKYEILPDSDKILPHFWENNLQLEASLNHELSH